MSDEEDENLFNALRAFKKARAELPAKKRKKQDRLSRSPSPKRRRSVSPKPKPPSSEDLDSSSFVTAIEPPSSEQLPAFEEAISKTDLRLRREHEALMEKERQQMLEKAKEQEKEKDDSGGGSNMYALPEITWHVPLTSFDYLKEEQEKRERRTMKDKEKAKRQRGDQSSQSTWKSETFMKLRQQFD